MNETTIKVGSRVQHKEQTGIIGTVTRISDDRVWVLDDSCEDWTELDDDGTLTYSVAELHITHITTGAQQ